MRFGLIFRGSQLFTMVVVGWMLMSYLLSHRAAMKADAPWKSVEDILNSTELPKCGATGTSDLTTIVLNILEETLGLKANNIKGYPGGVEIDLAIEKGEIHCRGTGITTHFAREPYFTWHKNGFDRHIIQTGAKKGPRMPDAPTTRSAPICSAMRQRRRGGVVGDTGFEPVTSRM